MRPIWNGSLSFGLVNIPIRLYTGTAEQAHLDLDMLHKKDFSPIRFAKICKAEEKEVPYKEVIKGYKTEDGEYVILTDEDFEKVNVKRTKMIEIEDFVYEEEVDTLLFEKPYFLEPDKGAGKAYTLLREALKRSKKVGIARFVLRGREHIAVIKPYHNTLVLNQLRYVSELRQAKDFNIPESSKMTSKELEMAEKLIDQLTVPFEAKRYHDTYTEDLKALIAQKSKGKKLRKVVPPAPKSTKVHDIMDMLKASLEQSSTHPRAKSTAKSRKKPKSRSKMVA